MIWLDVSNVKNAEMRRLHSEKKRTLGVWWWLSLDWCNDSDDDGSPPLRDIDIDIDMNIDTHEHWYMNIDVEKENQA